MAAVDPEAASVATNGDSSLKKKIRPNQITKQTAKTINSDSACSLLPLHQMDIKSAACEIPSNDFSIFPLAVLIFRWHIWSEALSAPGELCPFVLPRGLGEIASPHRVSYRPLKKK